MQLKSELDRPESHRFVTPRSLANMFPVGAGPEMIEYGWALVYGRPGCDAAIEADASPVAPIIIETTDE